MRQPIGPACLAFALLGSTVLARAEIGVPAAPGGFYLSLDSGYHHENGSNVAAQGTTAVGPGNGPGTGPTNGGVGTGAAAATDAGNANANANATNASAFAGGGAATFANTNTFSNPGGTASTSASNGSNGVAAASASGPANTTAAAGNGIATRANATANDNISGTSAGAAAAGSFGAFASASASLSGSGATAQAGGPGAAATATAADAGSSVLSSSDAGSFARARSGAFGDVEVGYVLPAPLYGVTRLEVYATGSMASQNSPVQGGFGFRGVDNNSAFAVAATPFGSLAGAVSQRDDLGEIGLRIKADRRVGPVFAAVSAEPFYLDVRQLTTSSASGVNSFGQRTSNVHGQLYGGQVAAEAVLPVLSRVSLVGRGSVGVYGLQSSGAFTSLIASTAGSPLAGIFPGAPQGGQLAGAAYDSQSRVGVRLGAQVGVRFTIAPTAWFTVLASVDHLSDVPTAVLPRLAGDRPAYVASRGYTDLRIGGRLTVATLGAP